jgi:hypothetical protein
MSASEQPKSEVERGQEEDKGRGTVGQSSDGGYEGPLFLKGRSDGDKGNAQDEKDGVGE